LRGGSETRALGLGASAQLNQANDQGACPRAASSLCATAVLQSACHSRRWSASSTFGAGGTLREGALKRSFCASPSPVRRRQVLVRQRGQDTPRPTLSPRQEVSTNPGGGTLRPRLGGRARGVQAEPEHARRSGEERRPDRLHKRLRLLPHVAKAFRRAIQPPSRKRGAHSESQSPSGLTSRAGGGRPSPTFAAVRPVVDRPSRRALGNRLALEVRISDLSATSVSLNHAVFAQRLSAKWAGQDSNLRPWD
jgi:hypothetical protein